MPVTLSVFPKYFRHLDAAALATTVRGLGLDTTNLVVRDGYWVQPKSLAEDVPRFLMVMRDHGLTVRFATTGYSAESLLADPAPLEVLARHGIAEFRLDWFRTRGDPRAELAAARAQLERLVPILEAHHIRAVYQLHHDMLVASASAAWSLVQGLPSRWLGIELDPGNQAHEGFEAWDKSVKLLGDHFVAMAIKDVAWERDPAQASKPTKGWKRRWCGLDEGIIDWQAVAKALAAVRFAGTLVLMPHYHEQDPARHLATLARDVVYFRAALAAAGVPTLPPAKETP